VQVSKHFIEEARGSTLVLNVQSEH